MDTYMPKLPHTLSEVFLRGKISRRAELCREAQQASLTGAHYSHERDCPPCEGLRPFPSSVEYPIWLVPSLPFKFIPILIEGVGLNKWRKAGTLIWYYYTQTHPVPWPKSSRQRMSLKDLLSGSTQISYDNLSTVIVGRFFFLMLLLGLFFFLLITREL